MNLLTHQSSNAKLSKNDSVDADWETWILYLAPANTVPGLNLCPASSPGCRAACLYTAGRGVMKPVQAGRIRKTVLYRDNLPEFMRQLVADLNRVSKRAFKGERNQAVRLNGTSDVAWETHSCERFGKLYGSIMEAFPELTFYDYTKLPARAMAAAKHAWWPQNYRLTFSRSEVNHHMVNLVSRAGTNIAVIFHGDSLPRAYLGLDVIDGTAHDMRFLDPKNVIVGLLPKGKAKRDTSGFAVKP